MNLLHNTRLSWLKKAYVAPDPPAAAFSAVWNVVDFDGTNPEDQFVEDSDFSDEILSPLSIGPTFAVDSGFITLPYGGDPEAAIADISMAPAEAVAYEASITFKWVEDASLIVGLLPAFFDGAENDVGTSIRKEGDVFLMGIYDGTMPAGDGPIFNIGWKIVNIIPLTSFDVEYYLDSVLVYTATVEEELKPLSQFYVIFPATSAAFSNATFKTVS